MLDGKRILVVEDEALLALDLCMTLEDMGAEVVGPCHRLSAALETAQAAPIDAAILDVDLGGEKVFPLADRLRDSAVPFVFHTGRNDPAQLEARYRAPVCLKPTSADLVARALDGLFAQAATQAMPRTAERPRL